ncbi:MAG: transcription elongation factor GreA [Spirochaeta sp. LUC14_002_19_P3]|nr:MAG: transcription elongation factor GreA [Spirochaeta sp. LUC14_002_19_P3]
MPENIIEDINTMLNGEKWTRAAINDYAISNFQNLDKTIDLLRGEELLDTALEVCDKHLETTKNSITALYLSGMISLSKHQIDDTNLLNLISIFTDNQRWNAVEYLCQRILDFGENKEALRTLADTLDHLKRQDDKYAIWDRLIKVDHDETDIVKYLAEKKETDGNKEEAVLYYRKAIHRYVNKNQFSQVREIWKKLVEQGVDDYEFFFLIEKKVAKSISSDKAVNLLEDLYPAVKNYENWDTAIEILKRILNYDNKSHLARHEIIECYKEKYADHSQLDECIKLSNLTQHWRSITEAIADFEKHISFDSGSFVYHKTWGVGIIKEIKDDEITIDFTKKRAHTMQLKMAVGALQSLSREHIWVLKSVHSKEKLKAKIKKDIPWALKTIIKSFDNVADIKKIKSELVPAILSAGEWISWSAEMRNILKTDPFFGNVPDKIDQFVVRDRAISFEEKTFNQFKAEKNFFSKIQTARNFLEHCDPDSEFFAEIFNFFTAFLRAGTFSPQTAASFLFVSKITQDYPFLNPGLDWGFKELWEQMEEPIQIFSQIEDSILRKQFLSAVHKEIEDWPTVYLSLLPIQLSKTMLDDLLNAGYKKAVSEKLIEMIEHYREYREGLVWIARHTAESSWPEQLGLNGEKILINMILLLNLTYSDIESKRDVSNNRKLNRQIQSYLFKEQILGNYLAGCDEKTAMKIYNLLEDIDAIDPVIKRDLKKIIQNRFPKIKLYSDKKNLETSAAAASRYFYTTEASLQAKQRELKNIIEVEIPKNSKEIGAAIELGDLSENAEYKAGKERQETLQIQAGKLKDELERARLFPEDEREADKIGFGTIITLNDLQEKKEETYTILGPWESNPSERIISYLSPFGNAFLGNSKGDTLDFTINDRNYKFKVKNVKLVAS